jgi:hypothetical protein
MLNRAALIALLLGSACSSASPGSGASSAKLSSYAYREFIGVCPPGEFCARMLEADSTQHLSYRDSERTLAASADQQHWATLVAAATDAKLIAALRDPMQCPPIAEIRIELEVKLNEDPSLTKDITGCTDVVGNPIVSGYVKIIEATRQLMADYFP